MENNSIPLDQTPDRYVETTEVDRQINPADFIDEADTDKAPGEYLDTLSWEQVKAQASGGIVIDEMDAPHSTVVGLKKTGKSTLMHLAGQKLDIPYVDAGLLFRAVAQKAIEGGYAGGDVPAQLLDRLVADVEAAELNFAQPAQGIDQSIVLGGSEYEYLRDLASIDPAMAGQISQNPAILRVVMDVLKSRTEAAHQLMFVGGRSLNQEFDSALARFFIEREGAALPQFETGAAWSLDSPQDNPQILRLLNPEDKQDLAAETMAIVVARRAEARVSEDEGYMLPEANSLLVTGEPAKAQEISSALAQRESLRRMPDRIAVPQEYLDELREGVVAKAKHARGKFAEPLLVVESTALHIPELYARGIPAEFIEWLSKKDTGRLAELMAFGETNAAAITVMAQINEQGEVSVSQGIVSGKFARQGRGEGGIGWDPHFTPDGLQLTYSEMGEEKSLTSSRAIAATELL